MRCPVHVLLSWLLVKPGLTLGLVLRKLFSPPLPIAQMLDFPTEDGEV